MSYIHTVPGFMPMALDAGGIASGGAFLRGSLEKFDPKLNEPLTSVTWPRDITAVTGGGWVDYTSFMNIDYATAGANQYGIISNASTNINTVQANVTKDLFQVFDWANVIRLPFIDQFKMRTIGYDLEQVLDKGLRLNYQKTLDANTYVGFSDYQTTGLVNNPNVTAALATAGASTSRLWTGKTFQEIMNDINNLITSVWIASQYDNDVMRNLHILIPPAKFAYLTNTLVGAAGSQSIIKYINENNIAAQQGGNLTLVPSRWCIGAGLPLSTGGAATDRMVVYVNDPDFVSMDLPVPLTRMMTTPVKMAYETDYVAQIGVVKFRYYQCVQYLDGI